MPLPVYILVKVDDDDVAQAAVEAAASNAPVGCDTLTSSLELVGRVQLCAVEAAGLDEGSVVVRAVAAVGSPRTGGPLVLSDWQRAVRLSSETSRQKSIAAERLDNLRRVMSDTPPRGSNRVAATASGDDGGNRRPAG
jgi:hypothetical protein